MCRSPSRCQPALTESPGGWPKTERLNVQRSYEPALSSVVLRSPNDRPMDEVAIDFRHPDRPERSATRRLELGRQRLLGRRTAQRPWGDEQSDDDEAWDDDGEWDEGEERTQGS